MNWSQLTDIDLVALFQKNEHKAQAFAEVYERTAARTFRFLYTRTGDRHVSEDLLNDTYVTLYSVMGHYNGSSQLVTFVIGIALNLLRRKYSEVQTASLDEASLVILEDVENSEVSHDSTQLASQILKSLPARYREILKLKFLENQTNQEIAQTLKLTLANVRQLQKRALERAYKLFTTQSHEKI